MPTSQSERERAGFVRACLDDQRGLVEDTRCTAHTAQKKEDCQHAVRQHTCACRHCCPESEHLEHMGERSTEGAGFEEGVSSLSRRAKACF